MQPWRPSWEAGDSSFGNLLVRMLRHSTSRLRSRRSGKADLCIGLCLVIFDTLQPRSHSPNYEQCQKYLEDKHGLTWVGPSTGKGGGEGEWRPRVTVVPADQVAYDEDDRNHGDDNH